MRTLILAATALSAVAAPAFAQDKAFNGPRAEVVAGYDSVEDGTSDANDADLGSDGFLYGGAIGYDVQRGKLVFGIEGEVTGATTKASDRNILVAGDKLEARAGRDFYAGARVGVTVTPSTLLYVKGGYTNARLTTEYTAGTSSLKLDEDFDGFRLGAGLEKKLTDKIYAKAEYRYSHYGETDAIDTDIDRHQLLAGVGVRF